MNAIHNLRTTNDTDWLHDQWAASYSRDISWPTLTSKRLQSQNFRIHGLFVHLRHAAAGRVVGGHFIVVDCVPRGQWNWGRRAKRKRQHDAFGKEDHYFRIPWGSSEMLHIQGFYPHNYVTFNGWNSLWLQQYELQQISACKVGGWWIFWWPVTLGWIIKTNYNI